jgi:adenine-specific DNA-methyltransferase
MPRTKKSDNGLSIESYAHADKERLTNPTIGLVTPDSGTDAVLKTYRYDLQHVWAATAASFFSI